MLEEDAVGGLVDFLPAGTGAAILEGSSLASFVVSHVRTAAAEVIRQHETIQLNQAESERFLKALTAPPAKPTARMARALELYKQTVTER
jgi:uncharacterized protein (DUF1778 family)